MRPASSSSTASVLFPAKRLSLAPILRKMASKIGSSAELAGTNDPIWAMRAMMATCKVKLVLRAVKHRKRNKRPAGIAAISFAEVVLMHIFYVFTNTIEKKQLSILRIYQS